MLQDVVKRFRKVEKNFWSSPNKKWRDNPSRRYIIFSKPVLLCEIFFIRSVPTTSFYSTNILDSRNVSLEKKGKKKMLSRIKQLSCKRMSLLKTSFRINKLTFLMLQWQQINTDLEKKSERENLFKILSFGFSYVKIS